MTKHTGCRTVRMHHIEAIWVMCGDTLVYTVQECDIPDKVLNDDDDYLFEWIMENYSSDIAECLEALGL